MIEGICNDYDECITKLKNYLYSKVNKFPEYLINISFRFLNWFIMIFNFTLKSIFIIVIIGFGIELVGSLPLIKVGTSLEYDPIGISNTFIVYITFIVVIGTVGLTLASLYFQKSIAKKEGEILNENLDKVLKAITTNKNNFNDRLVTELLNHKLIAPLIQEQLDQRVQTYKNQLDKQQKEVEAIKKAVNLLLEKNKTSPITEEKEIRFDKV